MGRPRRDHGQCPAEYLLHLRRLDAFLKHHGLLHTAYTLEMESRVLFEPTRLQMLVTQGKWSEADRYLRCFSALWKDDGDGAAQYTALQGSLNFNAVLAWLACRGEEGGRAAARFKPPSDAFRKADPEAAKLKDIYCSMTSQQARFVLCNLIAGISKLGGDQARDNRQDGRVASSGSRPGTGSVESIAAAHAHAAGHNSSRFTGISEVPEEESRS